MSYPPAMNSWSIDEQMAFWSNQLMMQQILEQQNQQWHLWQSQMAGNMFGPQVAMMPQPDVTTSCPAPCPQDQPNECQMQQGHKQQSHMQQPGAYQSANAEDLCHEPCQVAKPRPSMAPDIKKRVAPTVAMMDSPSNVKCRYGKRCTRRDCWYQHPDGRFIESDGCPDGLAAKLPDPSSRSLGHVLCQHAPSRVPVPEPSLPASSDNNKDSQEALAVETPNDSGKEALDPPLSVKDVYTLCREYDMPWPRQIALDGKLSDSVYDGSGYPMHFLHPLHSRLMVGLDDLDRVLAHLRSQGILSSEPPKLVSPGVLQAKFGSVKGSGNIQVYPSATGRSGGNARLNCGSTSQVHTLRTALLKSQWFWDAGPACITPLDSTGKLIQLADGRILLPPLSTSRKVADLKLLFQDVAKRLGSVGKNALLDYVKECGIQESHEVWPYIEVAFASAATKKRKKAE